MNIMALFFWNIKQYYYADLELPFFSLCDFSELLFYCVTIWGHMDANGFELRGKTFRDAQNIVWFSQLFAKEVPLLVEE